METKHESHSHHHVIPVKYYLGTFGALLVLTFLTVFVAQFHFGPFNIIIAMGIAIVKASLVIAFFMGLRWDKGFNIVILAGTLLFLALFFTFTLFDFQWRGDIDPIEHGAFGIDSPVKLIKPGEASHHGE